MKGNIMNWFKSAKVEQKEKGYRTIADDFKGSIGHRMIEAEIKSEEVNGYEIKFNPMYKKFQVSHPDEGATIAEFDKIEDAKEYAIKGSLNKKANLNIVAEEFKSNNDVHWISKGGIDEILVHNPLADGETIAFVNKKTGKEYQVTRESFFKQYKRASSIKQASVMGTDGYNLVKVSPTAWQVYNLKTKKSELMNNIGVCNLIQSVKKNSKWDMVMEQEIMGYPEYTGMKIEAREITKKAEVPSLWEKKKVNGKDVIIKTDNVEAGEDGVSRSVKKEASLKVESVKRRDVYREEILNTESMYNDYQNWLKEKGLGKDEDEKGLDQYITERYYDGLNMKEYLDKKFPSHRASLTKSAKFMGYYQFPVVQKEDNEHEEVGGDVIAIWDEVFDNKGNWSCYQHMGQHSACSPELINELKELTPEEVNKIEPGFIAELHQIGYTDAELSKEATLKTAITDEEARKPRTPASEVLEKNPWDAMDEGKPERETYTADADDLDLLIMNDSQLYNSQFIPMYKNLTRKMQKGTYDASLAPKLFMYLVNEGAKKWEAETKRWDPEGIVKKPSKEVKMQEAEDLAKTFEEEYKNKSYDFMDTPENNKIKEEEQDKRIQKVLDKDKVVKEEHKTASVDKKAGFSTTFISADKVKSFLKMWDWEAFSASKEEYLMNNKWMKDIVDSEKVEDEDRMIIHLKNGDFVEVENKQIKEKAGY